MAMVMCRRSTPSLLFCAFVCVWMGWWVWVLLLLLCVCVCVFFLGGGGEYKKNGVTLIIVDV